MPATPRDYGVIAGYPRISDDPTDLRAGVSRQRDDITAMSKLLGGEVIDLSRYEENNTSAYKKKRIAVTDPYGNTYQGYRVIRPKYHQALQDLRLGAINTLIVWDLDRLARDPRDLEDAIEAVEHYGATIVSATASEIDLTTDSGVMMARLVVLMANKASADTARRVKRAHHAHAMTGKPVGGTRPFGWEYDKVTVVEWEAELIRAAADRIIEGESLAQIVREWNAADVLSSRGNAWSSPTLRQMLRSPRYAGWRVHRGTVVLDTAGQPVRGLWEPILDQDTWDRLQLRFNRPDARTRKPRRDNKKYLLTGIIRCGVCNSVIYGNAHKGGKFYYVCYEPTKRTKHSVAGSGLAIDRMIEALVRTEMDKRAEQEEATAAPVFEGQARLDEIEVEIGRLMGELRTSDDRAGVFRQVAELEDEKAGMQEGRTRWLESTSGPALARYTDEQWSGLSVDARRAHVERLIEAVILYPATRRGNTFDPERLEVLPR